MSGKKKGWVEIVESGDGKFHLYDWSEHYDSGEIVGAFDAQREAVVAGLEWALKHKRKIGWKS